MNVRRIRIKTNIIKDKGDFYLVRNKSIYIEIPKSYVIKSNNQTFHDKKRWTVFYLDPDYFKRPGALKKMIRLKNAGSAFIYGKRLFKIHWDNVVTRVQSRSPEICFYCDEVFIHEKNHKFSKTSDHLIPTVILKAYGYEYIDNNEVPCCRDCNQDKASLHPLTWRVKVRNNIKFTGNPKWNIVLKTLNKILTDKKDPFNE